MLRFCVAQLAELIHAGSEHKRLFHLSKLLPPWQKGPGPHLELLFQSQVSHGQSMIGSDTVTKDWGTKGVPKTMLMCEDAPSVIQMLSSCSHTSIGI